MKKIQLCSGGLAIPGWESYDMDMDIRHPLRFLSASVKFIHCEHGIEHVTHQEAWSFLKECYRILTDDGVLRVAFPDITRMIGGFSVGGPEALEYMKIASSEGTPEGAIRAAIFNHGHQAAWNESLMAAFLYSVGFKSVFGHSAGFSFIPELIGIEQHHKTVGKGISEFETTVIEATK